MKVILAPWAINACKPQRIASKTSLMRYPGNLKLQSRYWDTQINIKQIFDLRENKLNLDNKTMTEYSQYEMDTISIEIY